MTEAQGTNVVAPVQSQPNAGITSYVDDTVGSVSETVSRATLLSSLVSLGAVSGVSSIEDYLSRPTRIASGNLTSTDSTVLFDVDPWKLQLAGIKAQKVSGIGMMRADIVVRLEINAVRFQAGRYILAWLPYGGTATGGSPFFKRMHTASLTNITQLPHVEIDLAKETHVTLRIPFTCNRMYMPVSTTLVSYGALMLYPYVALIPGSGSTTCPYTCWASFENIELSAPAIPQMGFSVKTPAAKEADEAKIGPISGFASKVAKTANIFGQVPVLTAAMSGVSWMSGIIGSAAKVWGFSRPTVLSPPVRVVNNMFPYMANSDQPTTGQPLAQCASNEVVIHSGVSPTNIDEMSIDFIKKQFAYVRKFDWAASDATDATLTTLMHIPSYEVTVGNAYAKSPITFLADEFTYWRGSLVFRFKLVKTEFHSGRLMISYSPYVSVTAPSWDLASTEYTYRQIVDIRDVSEFEVTVPFVATQPWLRYDNTIFAGALKVIVLDPLVAPSSVSSTVPILVEVSGGDDLEFAFPHGGVTQPVSPAIPMSGFSMPDVYATAPPATLGTTSGDPHAASAVTIGEKILSLRQLLKRTMMINGKTGAWSTDKTVGPSLPGAVVRPFKFSIVTQQTSNVTPYNRAQDLPDMLSRFACCYLFSSGSVNVRAWMPDAEVNSALWVDIYDDKSTTANSVVSTSVCYPVSSTTRFITATQVAPFVDVVVPNYNHRVARLNHAQLTGAVASGPGVPTNDVNGAQNLAVRLSNNISQSANWYIARPIGDDFQLNHWLGVPTVVGPLTV